MSILRESDPPARAHIVVFLLVGILSLFIVSHACAQEHRGLVEEIRRDLIRGGIQPAGIVNPDNSNPCAVFQLTLRVAWALREEGAGLLEKRDGNRCVWQGQPYSMDWVVYRDGRGSDIATGGIFDTVATDVVPAWNLVTMLEHGPRWRAPIDPGDSQIPPKPPQPVPPKPIPAPGTDPDHEALLELLATLERRVAGLQSMTPEEWQALWAQLARIERSIDEHRTATREEYARVKGFFRTWIIERIVPILGALIAGRSL